MLYTSWPNEPVKPLEKKFENLTKYSLKNKESIKKWYTIPSSDEGDMIETSPTLDELKLWGLVEPVETQFDDSIFLEEQCNT